MYELCLTSSNYRIFFARKISNSSRDRRNPSYFFVCKLQISHILLPAPDAPLEEKRRPISLLSAFTACTTCATLILIPEGAIFPAGNIKISVNFATEPDLAREM